ncbi:hypothetical protein Scep_015377 [Stephania cephalantha]|uniref:Exostosin GT47 domain-containing protein n=1 Tax=Stephania cephalantha TaxID=152367 RepID=A0AAP0J2V9_9MAGN
MNQRDCSCFCSSCSSIFAIFFLLPLILISWASLTHPRVSSSAIKNGGHIGHGQVLHQTKEELINYDRRNKELMNTTTTKLKRLEAGLARARAEIRNSAKNSTQTSDPDYTPHGPIYWNANAFHRSYLEMEKTFKYFVYEEGDPPLFHTSTCESILAIEGIIMGQLEADNKFRTQNHEEAHVFFLPFSVYNMVQYIWERGSYDSSPFDRTINDYINVIAEKYPYWNRSRGADHSMVACHDWAPSESRFNYLLFHNSIRVLCNANTSEGFKPSKDVTLPEIYLPYGKLKPLGGPSPYQRPILAFFAGGGNHGPIRPILIEHWKNKTEDMQVYEYLPKGMSYDEIMKKSRYCLCPSGYEVASPRIAESLYTGCVPVLLKEGYVPPFSDVLNWDSFSISVPTSEIPNLRKILMGISQKRYLKLQKRGLQVRRHFLVNSPPKRFDCLSIAISVGLLALILVFELATPSSHSANLTRISSSDFNASSNSKGGDYNASTILEIMRDHYDLDYDDEMDSFHNVQVDREEQNNSSLHVEHHIIKYDESVNKSTNGSSSGPRKEYTKLERIELGLTRTRAVIGKAARNRTHVPDQDYTPQGPIYWNAAAFQRYY